MITLNHTADVVKEVMDLLEGVDFVNYNKNKQQTSQNKVNEAYKILDKFNDELIREKIIIKQRRRNENTKNNKQE